MKIFKLPVACLLLVFLCCNVNAQMFIRLWGTTYLGGAYNAGCIFKTNSGAEDQTIVYSFPVANEGKSPYYSSLCAGSNDKLYGLTSEGGAYGLGVLFEYSPSTNTYSKKVDFNDTVLGKNPRGSLILATNDNLYGMTYAGGKYNAGIIFEYFTSNDSIAKKIDFNDAVGKRPCGNLVQAYNGKLYGMTKEGGKYGMGVLFEYDIETDTIIKKIDFAGLSNGSSPFGSLIMGADSLLYGLTNTGGANDKGVLFEYNIEKDTLIKRIDFAGYSNGSNPYGSLLQASNGKLYGMTNVGGTNNSGVLFEFDTATHLLQKKINFNGINGAYPDGSLVKLDGDKIFGQTIMGGTYDNGIMFEYNIASGILTKKADFNIKTIGSSPNTLVHHSDGKLYGMALYGGISNSGTLFAYDPILSYIHMKFDFNRADSGCKIKGGLLFASNGKLYGMTSEGGTYNKGVLFELDPKTNSYTRRFNFDSTNGANPSSTLIQATSGKIYGVTTEGGTYNKGVLFEFDPSTKIFAKKADFDGTKGANPVGSLIEGTNGRLFGMTTQGGNDDFGVIYQYEPVGNVLSVKKHFDNTLYGSYPTGTLCLYKGDTLFGLTREGGLHSKGVLFSYVISSESIYKQYDFDEVHGSYPEGSMEKAFNGFFYGMTFAGGTNNNGVIFEFTPGTKNLVNRFSFDQNDGIHPEGSFLRAYNQMFYGMTNSGGLHGVGTVFQYYPFATSITKKLNFKGPNGASPLYTKLIEICDSPKFTLQPVLAKSDTGLKVMFGAIALGNGLIYQWQVDTGMGFSDITKNDSLDYVDYNRETLIINKMTLEMHGHKFRCKVTSDCPVVTIYSDTALLVWSTGLRSGQDSEIHVFPNPTTGIFTIDLKDEEKPVNFTLLDITGRRVSEISIISNRILMDLTGYPNGMYILKATYKDKTKSVRVIKQ